MSHKIIYLAIPASLHGGNTSPENIDSIVAKIMAPYVEGTAEENSEKLDYYSIGGRWEGFTALKNGTTGYPAGKLAYQIADKYNALFCGGNVGPYVINDIEYIPVSGCLVKDMEWNFPQRLQRLFEYRLLGMYLPGAGSPSELPENWCIINGDLCVQQDGQEIIMRKADETFDEFVERKGGLLKITLLIDVDAYIDGDGVWHDEDELWEDYQTKRLANFSLDFDESKESEDGEDDFNPHEQFPQMFVDNCFAYLESLAPDDYIVIIDGHAFP